MTILDKSSKPRIQEGVDEYLKNNPVYFIPDYPLEKLSHQKAGDINYLEDPIVLNCYNTLSYKMLNHIAYHKTIVLRMCESFNFVITSIDQEGILSPLNLNAEDNVHPGNKRLLAARYLNLNTVPVLYDKKKTINGYDRISSLEELYRLYGTEISVRIVNRPTTTALEVSWHGQTKVRDENGNDDWVTASAMRDGFRSLPSYFLKNGLEIVNSSLDETRMIDGLTTIFSKTNNNDIYIEVLDDDILDYVNFWELYFHIDPLIHRKECSSGKINIVNNLTDSNVVLTNCSLYKTLTRA